MIGQVWLQIRHANFRLGEPMLRAATCRARGALFAAAALLGCMMMASDVSAASPESKQSGPDQWLVFVGTYAKAGTPGIYQFALDAQTGRLEPLGNTDAGANPTFLAIHPGGRFLYAAKETGNAQQGGEVSAYAIDRKSGQLSPLNRASSVGAGPCHLVVDAAGKHVLLANYGGGSVAVVAIKADGTLGDGTAFV